MENLENKKQLVLTFYERFYNQKNFEEARAMLSEDIVNRHSGAISKGSQSMIDNFSRDVNNIFPDIHIEVKRVIAEGDFVWTHGLISGLPGNRQTASVDIWKINDGKLAEHWDVQQPLKPDEDPRSIV